MLCPCVCALQDIVQEGAYWQGSLTRTGCVLKPCFIQIVAKTPFRFHYYISSFCRSLAKGRQVYGFETETQCSVTRSVNTGLKTNPS